ncbi:DoxX family protein [Bdellovibrio sp. HCB337]|uniref:DoxX family protein n=1 Tax=Bdellovibrio sp. HCB337 TaxID=3394358 RepID=UPI0039A4FC24
MNIFLWVLQVLLALHTIMGAVWKFSHSAEQTMPSLKAIPHGAWIALSVFELLCALCLVIPALSAGLAILIPIAGIGIALEMLTFCGLHLAAGETGSGPMIYWGVVAAVCVFVVYGRYAMSPLSL